MEKKTNFCSTPVPAILPSLRSAGKSCELLAVPGAGHVFNFLNVEQGEMAWEKTTPFLELHVKRGPVAGPLFGQGDFLDDLIIGHGRDFIFQLKISHHFLGGRYFTEFFRVGFLQP